MNDEELQECIARCRRLAKMITDDEMRHSLEQLADEYEAQLESEGSFMLAGSSSGPGPTST